MEFFATLGVALGLAMLAGINLYLTIFITGLAVRLGWLQDTALATALEGFGHPAVIAVSLGLFLVQFLADKVPWVDSLWDSIHTFLKPAGGVLLALTSLGDGAGTLAQIFVAVLALVGSLLTHWVKAGTRLHLNTSPEPFTNVGASVAEDLLVIGGYFLIANRPVIAFFVFALALAAVVYFTPRVTRSIRGTLWLIWRKLRVPASDKKAKKKALPNKLSSDDFSLLLDEFGSEEYQVVWNVNCVSGKTRNTGRLCRNVFGELIAIRERPHQLFFIGRRNFKKFFEILEIGGAKAEHESGFLNEELIIRQKDTKLLAHFLFHRGQGDVTERLTEFVKEKAKSKNKGEKVGEEERTAEDAVPAPVEESPEPSDETTKIESDEEDVSAPDTSTLEPFPSIEPDPTKSAEGEGADHKISDPNGT